MIALLLAAAIICRPPVAYDVGVAWLHGGVVVRRTIPASARIAPPPLLEIDPATRETQQLPFLTNGWPVWSPDSGEVAVTEPAGLGVFQTRLIRPDGTPIALLPGATEVAWSPDGRELAYAFSAPPGTFGVHVADASGGGERRVGPGVAPTWSRDGGRLAVQDGGWVAVVDLAGGAERRLVAGSTPAWSPRGDWIAYVRPDGDVGVVRPDGGGAHRLTRVRARAGRLAWSPDGSRLAVELRFARRHRTRLAVVAVASPHLTFLPDGLLPVWSPDGGRIAFTARGGVWLADVRTLRAQPLVPLC